MFKNLLKSDLLESGLSRLQDLQRKVESSFDEVMIPATQVVGIDSAMASSRLKDHDKPQDDIEQLRQQVESLAIEVRDKSNQMSEFKATNTALLAEGQKLSKRLGLFEEKARERQKELDAAQKTIKAITHPADTTRILHVEQLEADNRRLETEKAEVLSNQAALTAENIRLQTLYFETQALLSSKKNTPTPSPPSIPDNSYLHAEIANLKSEISRLTESLTNLETSAKKELATRHELERQLDDLKSKLELSEELRKLAAPTLPAPEHFSAPKIEASRWVFPEARSELQLKFEQALQAIGKLQDELEEAHEVQALLRQQLRTQVINNIS